MRPSNAVRTVWDAEAIDTSHLGFRPIQKIATIHASSGFIRGIPIKAGRALETAGRAGGIIARRALHLRNNLMGAILKRTWMVSGFKPLERVLPRPASSLVRSVVTAVITPVDFAFRSGHARSSFANRAVTAGGQPLPWYTYPAIDFLQARDFSDRTISNSVEDSQPYGGPSALAASSPLKRTRNGMRRCAQEFRAMSISSL
jgi:hypothetical protein